MIQVEGITKRFGATVALDNLSFAVERGERVGFVGPNGAGKTTTLRVLSGYLSPDSGHARVAGHSLDHDRSAACRTLGYMPERAPLHEDMRAVEFLCHRAILKGVPRNQVKARVSAVVEELQLGEVRRRLIARLSRGFRQRVALADALVADPKVLLLDEPTTGLDPLQRSAFRDILKTLGAGRSVLFSSHVLPEVEAVATRFLVLSAGKLVGDGSLSDLREQAGLSAEATTEELFSALVGGAKAKAGP